MYITVNDLKAVYILILDSKKGVIHTNYKYTLLAVDKKGVLGFLKIDGAKISKTDNKPYVYYNHQSGGAGLLQSVRDILQYLNGVNIDNVPVYNLDGFMDIFNLYRNIK